VRGTMKKHVNRSKLQLLSMSLLGFALSFSVPSSVRAQTQEVQVIEITARKYEYSGSPIHVKLGSKVKLKINATDHDHGFKIDEGTPSRAQGLVFTSAQDCWLLKKGETTIIEFLAQTPGTYTFKCCHTCGLGHKGMKGEIIVDR
jgi:heme/copper-type cytochrome/quinol oxidase subunit 2